MGHSAAQDISAGATATIQELEDRVEAVLIEVTQQPYWALAVDPSSNPDALRRFYREIYLRIHWYQPYTTEAGFHMLGRLPKDENRLLRTLLAHKAEEAEHGQWALRDYIALGGSPEKAERPADPPSFAVAGVWWRMAMTEDPYGYLGAEYLFEYLTARLVPLVLPNVLAKHPSGTGLGFLVEHATEDVKHTNLLRHWVGDVVTRHPETAASMLRCFDYFHHVYPIPVWRSAYDSAIAAPASE
jgi:hypothetical protein